MASSSETGHALNVAHLEDLITYCVGYGNKYNPMNASLQIASLNTMLADAKTSLSTTNNTLSIYRSAVADRENQFKELSSLVAKVLSSVESLNLPSNITDNIKAIVKKIKGTVKKKSETNSTSSTKSISTSQMSYDSRTENLDKLIQLLGTIPSYLPNEVELQIQSLTSFHQALTAHNLNVQNALVNLENARIQRDKILYDEINGLVNLAGVAKKYIKSLFGATSIEYKQVSKLSFQKKKG